MGAEVKLDAFPIPSWTPGHDVGPYVTAGCVVTKQPETGERHIGTYRMQGKGRDRTGVWINRGQHIGNHYELWERLTAVAKIPYQLDEYAVSGGLRGGGAVRDRAVSDSRSGGTGPGRDRDRR